MGVTNKPKKKVSFRTMLKRLVLWVGIPGIIIGIVGGILMYRYLSPFYQRSKGYDITQIDKVELPSIIFDSKNREIGRMYVENRSVISIDQMPQLLIDSLLAQEDQRFWENNGVDWIGIGRMAYLNLKAGKVTQGASTITMQLARNAFNLKSEALKRDEGGKERKIVEIFLASRIGRKYSSVSGKKFILENYLNRVPFGHGYYGVRSASLGYFGKEPKDLNWEEAASLVSCIKNPSAFSPLRFPENNKRARNHVFKRLLIDGKIDQKQYKSLVQLPIITNPNPLRRGTSHLYEKIGDLSRNIVGEEAMSLGGYRIYTTIDIDIQNAATQALKDQLNEVESIEGYSHDVYEDYDRSQGVPDYLQGALLVNNPKTGDVLAHVGGRNYNHTQFDFIDLGKRPLGTACLPFLYALGLDSGMTPSSKLKDEPIDNRMVMVGGREGILGEWGAETLAPKYEGEVSLRKALKTSKIAASVRLGRMLGVETFVDFARKIGLASQEDEKPLARDLLGWIPTSVSKAASAYSIFGNTGRFVGDLSYIKKIESSEGLLIYLQNDKENEKNVNQVIDVESSFQVNSILRETVKDGNLREQGEALEKLDYEGVVKSGTPYNFEDAWAFAVNENLTLSSWVGFQKGNKGAILENGFAKDIAVPVIEKFMANVRSGLRKDNLTMPENIVQESICKTSGLLATRYCFEKYSDPESGEEGDKYRSTVCFEYYRKGESPVEICSVHMNQQGQKGFADQYAPVKGITAAKPVLMADPVKPWSSVVIGVDPYGAVKHSAIEDSEQNQQGDYSSGLLILNDSVAGEEESIIVMPRPKTLQLKVEVEDLQPLTPRAVVVD